jgi:integrase
VKQVAKLTEAGRYRDERGLYLQVMSPTNRSWLLRYEREGRERWMGLGSAQTFTLEEARERARDARKLLADGIDPLEAKRAEKAARALASTKVLTFKEAAEQYFQDHSRKWSNAKHRAQFTSTLKAYVYPHIGNLPVAGIDTSLVLRVLESRNGGMDRFWTTLPETASRVRRRVEWVLDWAAVRGYRNGDNPARWKGHLDQVLPARAELRDTRHHPSLPYLESPKFMTALAAREGMGARALEFTILTAARTGEVTGARWAEIDLGGKTWIVPKERMKAGREHRVPLSATAVTLLENLPREAEFVFPGGRQGTPISNMAMTTVLRRMERSDITVHGFRSTFRDWAAEMTGYPNHVVEMALAHVIANKVEAAYRRGDLFDKRRRLMTDWARYCDQVPGAAESNIRSLREAGQ